MEEVSPRPVYLWVTEGREELREALQTYYGMMGRDPEAGVPLAYKLQELDVAWETEYLPR